jgi:hypothetical protein
MSRKSYTTLKQDLWIPLGILLFIAAPSILALLATGCEP